MSLHPNWKALSTVDFSWKQFVREGSSINKKNSKSKIVANTSLSGEEAKLIYEEVVGPGLSNEDKKQHQVTPEYKNVAVRPEKVPKLENDNKWINLLMSGAQDNDVVCVSSLLESVTNVDVRDQYGWTPLMSAACAGAVDVVRFLINRGADVDMKDKSGNTCISLARRRGHLAVIELITKPRCETQLKNEGCVTQESFYCEVCKQQFTDMTQTQHATSTVHLLCAKPRAAVPTLYGIPTSNKGYQMMVKGGWDSEHGLGPEGAGNKFPLKTVLKRDREGFGVAHKDKARVTHFAPHSTKAVQMERIVRRTGRRDREAAVKRERRKERDLRRELS